MDRAIYAARIYMYVSIASLSCRSRNFFVDSFAINCRMANVNRNNNKTDLEFTSQQVMA